MILVNEILNNEICFAKPVCAKPHIVLLFEKISLRHRQKKNMKGGYQPLHNHIVTLLNDEISYYRAKYSYHISHNVQRE